MGECPECGKNIWETVRQSVDPIRDRLPAIHNPNSVGSGLIWLSICMFLAALVQMVVNWFFVLEPPSKQIPIIQWWQDVPLNAMIAILTLPGIWLLWPARRSLANTRVLRSITLLIIGVVGWGLLGAYQWLQIESLIPYRGVPNEDIPTGYMWQWLSTKVVMLSFAIIFLWGLNGILNQVGSRSRKYRNAKGGRQRLREIGIAIIVAAIGMVLAVITGDQALHLIGLVVTIIANLVVLIGLAFLIVNTWWILQDLKPRASLTELLEAAPESELGVENTEDAGGSEESRQH